MDPKFLRNLGEDSFSVFSVHQYFKKKRHSRRDHFTVARTCHNSGINNGRGTYRQTETGAGIISQYEKLVGARCYSRFLQVNSHFASVILQAVQKCASSTRVAHFCTAPNSNFADFCGNLQMFDYIEIHSRIVAQFADISLKSIIL